MAEEPDSPESAGDSSQQDRRAPSYTVPRERIVSLDHPCIVKNVDNGIKSLGGEHQLKMLVERRIGDNLGNDKKQQRVGLSLRPDDPLAKKMLSRAIETRDVLIKVTVPKRTGRKRKRGSNEPFSNNKGESAHVAPTTASDLVQRLRDRSGSYKIEPVGLLSETHRFRGLPDFQLRAADLPIMQEIRDNVMPATLEACKRFKVDLTPGSAGITALIAPPSFVDRKMKKQPHTYEYQQSIAVQFGVDAAGNVTSTNFQQLPKRKAFAKPIDIENVPLGPPPILRPVNEHGKFLDRAVTGLGKLLVDRPIVTRRVAMNAVPQFGEGAFKEATQWVGYSFASGPWRDTLIRFGVDPRKDPQYRFYQTYMFQLSSKGRAPNGKKLDDRNNVWIRSDRHRPDDMKSHIFDGKSITANGKTWQFCDVTDPLLYDLIHTDDIAETCDLDGAGWYHRGTLAKIRTIMKHKMRDMFNGIEPDDNIYRLIASMPNRINQSTPKHLLYFDRDKYGPKLAMLSMEVRNMSKVGKDTQRGHTLSKGALWIPEEQGAETSEAAPNTAQAGSQLAQAGQRLNGNEEADAGQDEDMDEDEDEDEVDHGDFSDAEAEENDEDGAQQDE